MKFTVNREKLLEPLQLACGVVEKRQTSPVLGNLLVQVENGAAVIVGTDQEVELTVTIPDVTVEEAGEVTVPGRKFLDICRSLPEGADLRANLDGNRVAVDSGRFSSHLATLPVGDFPLIETGTPETSISLMVADLQRLLQRTSFAMAQQDVRYFFNGLLFEAEDELVRFVATNGQRLATSLVEASVQQGRHQYIVPRKAVMELSRLSGDDEEMVTLAFTSNHLKVNHRSSQLISKLIDATYPDYTRAIPGQGDKVMIADRLELKEALSRTAILSNELYRNVRLELSGGKLDMHANNPQQEEAEESVSVDYSGPDLEIGFNVSFLIEGLSALQGEKVRITMSDPGSACLIEDPDESETLLVISPMVL